LISGKRPGRIKTGEGRGANSGNWNILSFQIDPKGKREQYSSGTRTKTAVQGGRAKKDSTSEKLLGDPKGGKRVDEGPGKYEGEFLARAARKKGGADALKNGRKLGGTSIMLRRLLCGKKAPHW